MGILDSITTNATSPAPELTEEDFFRMFDQIRKPRSPHHHIISSRATPGSITVCHDCGSPVRVPDVWP
jgi:hypothetical protein